MLSTRVETWSLRGRGGLRRPRAARILALALLAGALASPGCTFDSAGVEPPASCGDGVATLGEQCDVADHGGATCTSLGLPSGTLSCNVLCRFDTTGCTGTGVVCGDGVIQGVEVCDGASLGGATCASLGLGSGTLGCSGACTFDTSGCAVQAVCGDGQQEGGEQCDDGNNTPCDGCSASCQVEVCGNGRIECGEQCDDGNQTLGDGCDAQCHVDVPPACGDGNLDNGEECDDGNNAPCDGCSSACRTEGCGNGVAECGEECDDGNATQTDACLNDCSAAGCGDGHLHVGVELCEPGNVPSTCADQGFDGGTLGCAPGCQAFDTSGCTITLAGDGAPCAADGECTGGMCYEESVNGWPSGFCTRDCGGGGSACEAGLTCINLGQSGSYADRCYELCAGSGDCRGGYVCTQDPFEQQEHVCRPLCETNAHCPDTGMCNPWSGWCGSLASNQQLDNGAACSSMSTTTCKGTCWTQPTGGYCISPCNLYTGVCPGDGVCVPDQDSEQLDKGWCLDGCTGTGDCRGGYSCVPASGGGGNICWPN